MEGLSADIEAKLKRLADYESFSVRDLHRCGACNFPVYSVYSFYRCGKCHEVLGCHRDDCKRDAATKCAYCNKDGCTQCFSNCHTCGKIMCGECREELMCTNEHCGIKCHTCRGPRREYIILFEGVEPKTRVSNTGTTKTVR